MEKTPWLVVTTACLTIACAQGARAQDDGGVPAVCGALTDDGACFDETAVWCSVPNVAGEGAARNTAALDCDARGGTCALVDSIGAWCVVPDGAPCALGATDRVAQLACGDGVPDDGLACDLDEGCRPASAPCPADGEAVCVGDTLVLSCAGFGQPLVVRCGGACEAARCVGQPASGLCDDDRLLCDEGLSCVAARCVDDAVAPATDAGPDRREPFAASSCACASACRPWTSGAPVLAVLVVVVGRRRRV